MDKSIRGGKPVRRNSGRIGVTVDVSAEGFAALASEKVRRDAERFEELFKGCLENQDKIFAASAGKKIGALLERRDGLMGRIVLEVIKARGGLAVTVIGSDYEPIPVADAHLCIWTLHQEHLVKADHNWFDYAEELHRALTWAFAEEIKRWREAQQPRQMPHFRGGYLGKQRESRPDDHKLRGAGALKGAQTQGVVVKTDDVPNVPAELLVVQHIGGPTEGDTVH